MSKNKSKEKKGKRSASPEDLKSVVKRLRKENEALRSRLAQIAELTSNLPAEDAVDSESTPTAERDEELSRSASL